MPRASVSRAPRRRRSYHHGDLRRALVAAATDLLDRHGPLGVTLRGAARAAGVSQAAPYRHFASKEALLAAVAEGSFHALRDTCEAAARKAARDDPAQQLKAVASAYVRFAAEDPARYRLMWAPSPRGRDYPALGSAAGAAGQAVLAALTAWQLSDGSSPERPVEHLFVFWALLHGLAGLVIDEQLPLDVRKTVPVDVLAQTAIRVLLEGLQPSAAPTRTAASPPPSASPP